MPDEPPNTATAPTPLPPAARWHASTREQWLLDAMILIRDHFQAHGTQVPPRVRVSVGFAPRGGTRILGFCCRRSASEDGATEIFVSPTCADPAMVMGVLIHETCHASLPDHVNHGAPFARLARSVGLLSGPPVRALPGSALREQIESWIDVLGPHPHARLSLSLAACRLRMDTVELACAGCGLRLTTADWEVVRKTPPSCGACKRDLLIVGATNPRAAER